MMKKIFFSLFMLVAVVTAANAQSTYQAAWELYQSGDYQAAAAKLMESGSNMSADEMSLMGTILYEMEAYDYAALFSMRALEKGLTGKERQAWAYTHMAVALEEHQEWALAMQSLNKAVKLLPNDPGIMAERGNVNYALGKLKPAEKDLLKAIALDSTRVLPYITLAYVREKQGNPAGAMAMYNMALLRCDYREGKVLAERAVFLLNQQDTVGAMRDLISACSVKMAGRTGRVYNSMLHSVPEKMEEALMKQAAREPFNPLWPALIGDVKADGLKDVESAIGYYYQSFMIDASDDTDAAKGIEPGKRMILYFSNMSAYDEMLAISQHGLEVNPESVTYETGLIDWLLSTNQMDSVLTMLQQRVDAVKAKGGDNNEYLNPLFAHARMLRYAKRYEEAISELDQILHEAMNNTNVLLLQGKCYHAIGEYEKAKVCMDRVIENYGDKYVTDTTDGYYTKDGYIYDDDLIQAYFYAGDTATALAGLIKRDLGLFDLKKQGQDISEGSLYNEACMFAILGQREEALAHLDSAMANGYLDISHIRVDEDFACLHGTPELEAILIKYDAIREEKLMKALSGMVAPELETMEQKAHFMGGEGMQEQFIKDNLRPVMEKKQPVKGTLVVEATIEFSGEVTDAAIVSGSGDSRLMAEAVRVVKMMPRFEPTRIGGRAVQDTVEITVEF